MEDKLCATCIKRDVCNIKESVGLAVTEIDVISKKTSLVDVAITCKKYYSEAYFTSGYTSVTDMNELNKYGLSPFSTTACTSDTHK